MHGAPCIRLGRDISTPLCSGWAEEYHAPSERMGRACLPVYIYPLPFIADGPRNIMRLLSAWAEPACQWIYPPPCIADGPRNIMCLRSTWAKPACQWIYPPPFIAEGPRNIMCLRSAWAKPACQCIYIHSPS